MILHGKGGKQKIMDPTTPNVIINMVTVLGLKFHAIKYLEKYGDIHIHIHSTKTDCLMGQLGVSFLILW
jgi:hypothetical protein